MQLTTVKELFKERDKYLNQEIQVGGWIRSIRDSKAFGFIVLNDGTSFDTLQIVYHDTMANFAEVSKLNVGASIIVKGTLVATPEAKQPFAPEKTSLLRISSYDPAPSRAYKYLPGCIPCAFPDRLRDPSVLPGAGLRLCPHSVNHLQ